MDQLDRLDLGDAGADATPAEGSDRPNGHIVEWTAPTTRQEAEEQILVLSGDIGMILAQLAEDQTSWCSRTGRTVVEHSQWRRRALFAKVHKERQLRECKRLRASLHPLGADGDSSGRPERGGGYELARLCRRVVHAWRQRSVSGEAPLDQALADLACHLESPEEGVRLVGVAELGAATGS